MNRLDDDRQRVVLAAADTEGTWGGANGRTVVCGLGIAGGTNDSEAMGTFDVSGGGPVDCKPGEPTLADAPRGRDGCPARTY